MTTYDLGKVVGENGQDGDDGNGISSVTKTGTSGLVDTYTITFTNGDTTTFQVTNGSDASVTIVSSWSSTTSNSKVPSEKLTKDSLDDKVNKSSTSGLLKNDGTVDTTSYSTFSGNYNDLSNKPTIPSASSTTPSADTTSGSYGSGTSYARSNHSHPKSSLYAESSHTHTKSQITDFPSLSTVATSGSYADLSNKPSIPSSSSDLSDGSNIVKKSSTTGLLKNDGSVDANSYLTTSSASSTYQVKLTSGTNIKTINNESLLGSGNISVGGGSSVDIVTAWESTPSDSKVASEKLTKDSLDGKANSTHEHYGDEVFSSNDLSNLGIFTEDSQDAVNLAINNAIGNKISKSQTTGLVKNDGTIDTNTYLTSSAISGMLTSSDIANNLTTTTSGKVLDARQGKALADLIGDAITYINQ